MTNQYVIGLDFGTDSVRAVLIDASNGETVSSHVHWYESWKKGKYCNATINQFRQHPLDHIKGLEVTLKKVIQNSNIDTDLIKSICIDTTGSSPIPVDKFGNALSLDSEFAFNPNAMMVLWKDHTAIAEAEEITQLAQTWGGKDFTKYVGGIYSSEWFWAKILHIIREDEAVKNVAYSWMEHCDYMTFLLVDSELTTFKRSRCAAGHKAMWHESWGGLPDDAFLHQLDPYLVELKKNLYTDTYTSDISAGTLKAKWADYLGLNKDTIVSVGSFDAHLGAVGGEIKPGYLSKVIGTSTCDIMIAPIQEKEHLVSGICGQVNGSVIPNMLGLEAGQSAFGDVYAWFKKLLMWPAENMSDEIKVAFGKNLNDKIIPALADAASQIEPQITDPVSLDWMNGRRTPDANQELKGVISGINLGSDAPRLFKSLVEATCFGARKIVERFRDEGVEINGIIALGGVSKKSTFAMQTLADVLQMPIKIGKSEQTCALGAAMFAAVASGIYGNIEDAMKHMGAGFEKTYQPNLNRAKTYDKLYDKYCRLGESIEKLTQL